MMKIPLTGNAFTFLSIYCEFNVLDMYPTDPIYENIFNFTDTQSLSK